MPKLRHTLEAWGSTAFPQTLKDELEALAPSELPLERASASGYVADQRIVAAFLSATETERHVVAEVGLFFTEVLAGCSCGDDPAYASAYCEIKVSIDKASGEAEFALI